MSSLKVRKVGNSLGVVLPKELLARLKVKDGDNVYASEAPDGSVRLTAYDPAFEEQMKAAQEGMAQYRNTLRELAK
ncbi:MAG: AbrB/MazE/SpoVT family DNA-binding domain-containing protein [Pseudomonadota bacterium]